MEAKPTGRILFGCVRNSVTLHVVYRYSTDGVPVIESYARLKNIILPVELTFLRSRQLGYVVVNSPSGVLAPLL